MDIIFWISTLLIFYIYIGYPLLLRYLPRKPLALEDLSQPLPRVSVLIPAFNEAKCIVDTIHNKLNQDYPAELIEIIVISDESEDDTDNLVNTIATQDPRVHLIRQMPRQGKTSGLNLAIPQARGDIIVFSDANSHYHPQALRELVNCFNDPEVGYATGKMVYVNADGSLIGDGCSAYMKYENHMRRLETQVGSIVGVDGGIDAIRKSLYQPMNADQLPDFVLPLKVVTQGKRVIFCESALLNEESLSSAQSEFRMRVRVSLRAYWAMWDMKHLFDPFRYGIFTLQLTSHKLLRYLAFIPLSAVFISNGFITGHGSFYQLTFLIQILFYGAAAFVSLNDGTKNRWLGLTHYFCLINIASTMAFLKFIKGEKIVLWKPRVG
ncbi:glycosyltransferase family 2 protein [Cellvibrio japonicus]|uniref:Glycosyl transferase, putative, gt2M n=1 Tax=Cellvibrio japonicus (strain Ueda107) TaxID=498211 RepID=B3PF91_CELJU|nr:glycosyltransferase family 2 protein [Cellvibrio japonicus]ACE83022.1 glycosyl transferase, putative, gt2M [Cellvibrio japonicus Ueda107]QEI13640.1 glycosyltransferase family 2 protein [Cellvibrio japonicus]QEI17213.1 glycosyltransferase family 2 protein [Cellvibrio japonicus]QEI20791.1 glycosyltransferase family 2 protein [Cellvibrio japonicus]